MPVIFPLLDVQDQRSVSFSDIWGGFDDALLEQVEGMASYRPASRNFESRLVTLET